MAGEGRLEIIDLLGWDRLRDLSVTGSRLPDSPSRGRASDAARSATAYAIVTPGDRRLHVRA
jgi:hypothetical protein